MGNEVDKPYKNLAYQLLKAGANVSVKEYAETDNWFIGASIRREYTIDGNEYIANEHWGDLRLQFDALLEYGLLTSMKYRTLVFKSQWFNRLEGDAALEADELHYQAYLQKKALREEFEISSIKPVEAQLQTAIGQLVKVTV